ncbi:MAG: DUF2461 domain-containing protein [Bacillota bacterium]
MPASAFEGFTPETFLFLMEIRFNNNKDFFEANRARYNRVLKAPLQALAVRILPCALKMNAQFDQRVSSIVSRIRRDTRYSADKSLYRDHAWLGFRLPGSSISEQFTPYFEITPESYGYGMGMYAPDAAMMRRYRAVMLAWPSEFLAHAKRLEERGFVLEGDAYKRDRFPDAPEALKPYLNRKAIAWCFSSPSLAPTLAPSLADEIADAFDLLRPMYCLLHDKLVKED